MTTLHVERFAQIESAKIRFGDLTVLVGPQATGKSLILQWLKVAVDGGEIMEALREAGHDLTQRSNLIDLTFGEGMAGAWKEGRTSIQLDGRPVHLDNGGRRRRQTGAVLFVPAQRALLLSEGWPAPFLKLGADVPVVARLFSQNLYLRFSGRQVSTLFPAERVLKEEYRDLIDRAVFHGGRVELDKQGLGYRLRLAYENGVNLPFMTWTAGQRELTPLLLGLYQILAPRKQRKNEETDWVVIEEPEMGLHPQAITVFMMIVLDMLWRGYRVVLSTHSPLVLDVVWAIRRLAATKGRWQLLADAFDVSRSHSVHQVIEHALTCDYRVYFLQMDDAGQVRSRDISELDPGSADAEEADWGGLTGFSSRFGEAVRAAVNESEE